MNLPIQWRPRDNNSADTFSQLSHTSKCFNYSRFLLARFFFVIIYQLFRSFNYSAKVVVQFVRVFAIIICAKIEVSPYTCTKTIDIKCNGKTFQGLVIDIFHGNCLDHESNQTHHVTLTHKRMQFSTYAFFGYIGLCLYVNCLSNALQYCHKKT